MIKQIILYIGLNLLISPATFCQKNCVSEGKNYLNMRYTLFDLNRYILKEYAYSGCKNLNMSGFAPIGMVFEHVVNPRFSFGLESSYGKTRISYSSEYSTYNGTKKYYTNYQDFSIFEAGLRMNFHCVNTQNYNVYQLLEFGYRNIQNTYSSTNPEFTSYSSKGYLPVSLKYGLGFRYISDNMGCFVEMALSTQMLNFGMCVKL